MRIGLFGGSFDPIHQGHLELALTVLKEGKYHQIWFIPAYDQPLKDNHHASYQQRVKMIKAVIAPYRKLKISLIEQLLPSPSYTFNTVKALQAKHPQHQFSWIVGSDAYQGLDKWYQIEELRKLIDFVVVTRDNIKVDDRYQIVDFDHPASSTAIREGHFKYLPYNARKIAYKERLYLKEVLYQRLSQNRADHVCSALQTGLQLASVHNVDETAVYLAIILHDITKELPDEQQKQLIDDYFSEYKEISHKVWHQYTATIIAQQDFMISDKAVLRAIAAHTTADDISNLGMITYLADKLEATRKYPYQHLLDIALLNLKQGFNKTYSEVESIRKRKDNV